MHKKWRHGTHVPVLRYISKKVLCKNVMEFGAGAFSTSTFLDKNYFKDLLSLHSYESNDNWIKLLKKNFEQDERFCLHKISEKVEKLKDYKYIDADILFVDGPSLEHRVFVVKKMKHLAPICILHDAAPKKLNAKRSKLNRLIKLFKYKSFFYPPNNVNPTSILSNSVDVSSWASEIVWSDDYKNILVGFGGKHAQNVKGTVYRSKKK